MALPADSAKQLLAHFLNLKSVEDTISEYNRLAHKYDSHFLHLPYGVVRMCCEAVKKWFPEDNDRPRGEIRVFDVAAGSGHLGKALHEVGFRAIDALDASEKMLAIAKELKVYRRILVDTIGDHRIDVEDETYDLVTMSGGFAPKHCPLTALNEMARVTKPGGLIIFAMRVEHLINCDEFKEMEPLIQSMEKGGLWLCVSREMKPCPMFAGGLGAVYVIRKL